MNDLAIKPRKKPLNKFKRVGARLNWRRAATKIIALNRAKANRARARRKLSYRAWAAKRGMFSNRYRNFNWHRWAKAKRMRYVNSGYNMRTYKFYK